jgi:hypothetical protein
VFKPQVNKTQDRKREGTNGYVLCSLDVTSKLGYAPLRTDAENTGEGIGDGRANTALLLADPTCQRDPSIGSAVALVHAYRGGGLSDWYLPSKDELTTLYGSAGRNYVGGFNANGWYVSSSTEKGGTTLADGTTVPDRNWNTWAVRFDIGLADILQSFKPGDAGYFNVRPIRAFS